MIGFGRRVVGFGATVLVAAGTVVATPASGATHHRYIVRFSGVRHVRLGESVTKLRRAGYSGRATTSGCAQYHDSRTGLYVTVSPRTRTVVAVDPVGDRRYRAAGGIHLGSTVRQVRHAYRGHLIKSHLDGSFGQGADGLLVRGSHNRWLGFLIDGHGKVAGIKLARHRFAGANEVSC